MTPAALADAFRRVRRQTTELVAPLAIEDYVAQSMPDTRPAKWHVGHTSWYFETFVLGREDMGQGPVRPEFREIFGVSDAGVEVSRDRGVLSRPTVAEVFEYRRQVDGRMEELLAGELPGEVREFVVLGLHHEQQHQERLLADLKHLFSRNPLHPVYREASPRPAGAVPPLRFVSGAGGAAPIGHEGTGFAYDNERPRHETRIAPFQLGSRLITNGEYAEFIEEGGYRHRPLWLADGWDARTAGGWEAPLHWVRQGDRFAEFTLGGLATLRPEAPVAHVSYFEADAFARWREARLPTEFEWEAAAADLPVTGTFVENGDLQPEPAPAAAQRAASGPVQLFGDAWEWTASAYLPYPGFRPSGRFGQSSGRSMSGRMVLRGGSCFTPALHLRATYRHVLRPDARWQATGIRIARDG
jgi:ergothioneine biosynthesis protein EgtB